MAGDEVTGATVFSLVEELDAGPVLGTITELIRDDDTTAELLERLADWGSKLLVDVVDHIEDGDIAAVPQPEDNISFAPKLTTDDGRIEWNRPAFAIDRHIRGCTPAPGAWTTLAGERVKIGPATIAQDSTLEPGLIGAGKREVRVGTATTDLVLGQVQAVGKNRMAAADWARGTTFDAEASFS
jgi:methionyl-tRNA formyltransferase